MRVAFVDSPHADFRVDAIDRPVPGPGQVLVRIANSGVNPLDVKIRQGAAAHAKHPLPGILGIDLAGTVEAVGSGTTEFSAGDEVYGMTGGVGGVQGSLAEYAAVDARLLALKPRSISLRQAAALPLIAITAWEGLIDRANVQPGQTVLVQGGAGGVGHIVIQIALARGARVFATGSQKDLAWIAQLGATPIDRESASGHRDLDEHTQGHGFDIIYDTVGGQSLDAAFGATAIFGHVVSTLGWGAHSLAPLSFRAGTYSGVFTLLPLLTGAGMSHHGHILREVAALVDQGSLIPKVDARAFTLSTVGSAHAVLEAGQAAGKLVIDVA